ncbi:alkaline phosphatase [Paraglaciecola hydrolytica]|uniref:Alkaline phosphatase n=1 Tax=Paraglaciecola hydrolytica TaxID=1799789 RepID=A0A135ZZY9_9ALTE|nr:alkaline phosphatase [Paraglaciecola hydrolytica]KXI28532.1 alkaline phosphatase [Paraglaciecola hydrolytica]
MKKSAILLLASVCSSVLASPAPKNIIMVVGDGMGPEYTTAYRMYMDDKNTPELELTIFDQLLVGMASTHPDLSNGYVTDSAAGATSLATGVKTYNGAIGMDINKQPVQTVLEYAKQQGRKTGVAVTSQINHATPAGFSAHNVSRQNYDEIANSYFDQRINGQFTLDVMLGGGWTYFIRKDRNLVEEFKQAGYEYIDTMAALANVSTGKPLLGLFDDTGLAWALDAPNKQRLPALVNTAVKQLENDKGFFLLVEGSQIDWGGHSNDIAAAMGEMHDLGLTLQWLADYVEQHPDTLFVVTADHSTGGMTIGARGKYEWDPSFLHGLKSSPSNIASLLVDAKDRIAVANEQLGFELNDEEQSKLTAINSKDSKAYYKALKSILDVRSHTGWTTSGHTGVDVQIFAKGPGSDLFRGHLDNTDIAKNVFKLLGKK